MFYLLTFLLDMECWSRWNLYANFRCYWYQRIYRRRSRREQQLAITAYVTRMGIMGNLLPDW